MENELEFENELIEALSTGEIGDFGNHIVKTRLWEFRDDIHTTDALWENFAEILYRNNQDVLEHPLSYTEFSQVKKVIEGLTTPYKAGQFLYGYNGVSQVEVDLDDGRHVFLTVFDQDQIGAGSTVYQVVHQIQRPKKIIGKKDRRFDVTLLINGLPIIQIELKSETGDIEDALNQMHQYIVEDQYTDIYSTLQILVAMTPYNCKYMANTTAGKFNKDFAFNWQSRKDNKRIVKWREFTDLFLSIPAAHRMSTTYMILDGTHNEECIKVMRPYQVYATEAVINAIKAKAPGEMGIEKLGYVWHTTGSGKTITSFKTAWIASRLPGVDKVVFLVDRKQLTRHTYEKYRAYDPEATSANDIGKIVDTKNAGQLASKLNSKRNDIIITSVQKLEKFVKSRTFKAPDRNIIFIVDEAHRSTGTDIFEQLQKNFPHSGWVGYTGTPTFDDKKERRSTKHIFGKPLHSYTIRHAIADKNVLGFKVDFQETVPSKYFYEKELPEFYRKQNPSWTDEEIANKINNLSDDEMDDQLASKGTVYDNNPSHVKAVVEDIYKYWQNRSNNGQYNALLTTHVGGQKSSINMAMMYFDEFCRMNDEHRKNGGLVLKVAVTFSEDDSNGDAMVSNNQSLNRAIDEYNKEFKTSWGMDTVDEYKEDLIARLDKSADDGNYLDIVIVVDQLLTGFDAPGLNTLYVDRTLRGASLIQAYSRTNRVHNMQEKPWGQVINYRWPKLSEKLMNEALIEYSKEENADKPESQFDDIIVDVMAKPFNALLEETKVIIDRLRVLTDDFNRIPPDKEEQIQMFGELKKYNGNITKLKQYPYKVNDDGTTEGYDYNNPDELITKLGMTEEENKILSTTLTNELKHTLASEKHVDFSDIDLTVVHLKDVYVDYSYLTELIEKLMNEVHDGEMEKAQKTKEDIDKFATGLDSPEFARAVKRAAEAIINKIYPKKDSQMKYPYTGFNVQTVVAEAQTVSIEKKILDFRNKWGITDAISMKDFLSLVDRHKYGEQDLDENGEIGELIFQGSLKYTEMATDPEVRLLRRLKYRNELRNAIYDFADRLLQGDDINDKQITQN